MRKKIVFALISICFVILLGSCSSDTYADKVRKEEKNIKEFIVRNKISVITSYPHGRAFNENEYFHYNVGDTEVYMHVIDSGVGEMAKPSSLPGFSGSVVILRFDSVSTIGSDALVNLSSDLMTSTDPVKLTYGIASTYQSTDNTAAYYFLSPAAAEPLKYVRNGAVVSLIVPFKKGSGWQYQYYETLFCGQVTYRFE